MDNLRSRLHTTARGILLAVVLLAPWLLGGVELASQRWLYGGVLISFACWGLGTILPARESGVRFPAVALPLAGALLLGAVQLLPLPDQFTFDRPDSATGFAGAAPAEGSGAQPLSDRQTLRIESQSVPSFSPADTRLSQAHLLMALLVVFLAADLFSAPQHQPWLWIGLAVDGAALAAFGIVQKINWNGQLFWSIPLTHGGSPFASYVNRNNATGFLNIALAAAAGWVIWALCRPVSRDASASGPQGRNVPRWPEETGRDFHDHEQGSHRRLHLFGAMTAAGIIVAGVVCSLSRSGFIGAAGGALAALVPLVGRKKLVPAAAIVGCALGLGLAVVMWTGQGKAVERRLATLGGEQKFADARLSNWRDAWQAAQAFPVLGSGFGTYRFAYRPFQSRHHDVWFQHAENQYLQALVEGGFIGLVLLVTAIALVFRDIVRLTRRSSISGSDAVAACGLFAIVSQCLQGVFDFGLYLPANMMALATICGAMAGSTKRPSQSQDAPRPLEFGAPRTGILRLASVVVLAAWGAIAWTEVSNAAAAHRAVASVPPLTSPKSYELPDLDRRLAELEAAVQKRPDDAELHGKIAEIWVYRYRRLALQRLQPDGGGDRKVGDQKLWDLTDLAVLHRQANQRFRFDPPGSVERLQKTALVAENLTPAVEHLLGARTACPLLPEIEVRLAALAFIRNPQAPQGESHIRRAMQLAATEPVVLFEAGVLAKQAGLKELCFSSWKQSLAVSPVRQRQIMADVRGWTKIDEILENVLPDDPEVLLDVLSRDYGAAHFAQERSLLMQRAREMGATRQDRMSPPQLQHLQARIHALEGRPEAALESYRRAIALAPFEAGWRFELAQLLEERGQPGEAREQAEICLSLRPELPGVQRFLDRLPRTETRRPHSSASGLHTTNATYLSGTEHKP